MKNFLTLYGFITLYSSLLSSSISTKSFNCIFISSIVFTLLKSIFCITKCIAVPFSAAVSPLSSCKNLGFILHISSLNKFSVSITGTCSKFFFFSSETEKLLFINVDSLNLYLKSNLLSISLSTDEQSEFINRLSSLISSTSESFLSTTKSDLVHVFTLHVDKSSFILISFDPTNSLKISPSLCLHIAIPIQSK